MVQRSPVLQVFVDGRLLPNVTGARVTRGFEQEFATAQVQVSGSAPAWVKQGSQVAIRMGGTVATAYQRFFGYVGPFGSNLWAPSDTLECGDVLMFAKYFRPSSDVDLSNMTDEQIVTRVFQEMGLPAALIGSIGGTGKIFGEDPETPLIWPPTITAASVLEEVDSASLGWRTWVDAGGVVRRTEIVELPTDTPAATFTEGVDIISGTSTYEIPDPVTEVSILGDDVSFTVDDGGVNTFAWHTNPFALPLSMISQETTSETHLSAQEVAEWLLEHLGRNLVTVNLVTHRDDLLSPDMTVETDAPHLRNHNLFWVQNVISEVTTTGQFRQQLQLVSERSLLDLSDLGPIEAVDPFTGEVLPLPPPPTLPPGEGAAITVSFSLDPIDREVVVVDGEEATLYTVHAVDTTVPTSAEVATRAWTAAGTGVVITSGTEAEFTTAFTSLTGASITLEVTDTLGNTGSLERPLDDGGGAPIKVKTLYAATSADWEVFDGATWRTHTPADAMLAIAPGPQASAGTVALRTEDYLATAAQTSSPFGGGNVTAIWVEEDHNATDVYAGNAVGSIATSTDGGATWTPGAGPGGEVRRIIASRFQSGELHAIVADSGAGDAGYYTSADNGDTWTLQRAGDFVELVLSHSRNVVITAAGAMERAEEPGDAFTFPGSPTIVAAAPHIRTDDFYAWASDGSTYATDAPGSFAMEARQSVTGTPATRGADNDGETPGLLYFATSSDLYKSLDGLQTAEGILTLRTGAHILVKHGILTNPPGTVGGGIFVATGSGVYAYNAQTDSWADISPVAGWPMHAIAAVGTSVWAMQTDSTQTLHYSSDSGASWTTVALPGDGDGDVESLTISDTGTVLVAAYRGDGTSSNNGIWTRPADNSGGWTQVYSSGANNVTTADVVGARCWFTLSDGTTSRFKYLTPVSLAGSVTTVSSATAPTGAEVAISGTRSDETRAWASYAFDPGNTAPKLYRIIGSTGADATPPGLLASQQAGVVDAGARDSSVALALYHDNTGANTTTIYRSDDGGVSWTDVHTASGLVSGRWPLLRWSISSTDRVVVAWGNTLAISNDAGLTWTDSSANVNVEAIAVT